MSPSVSTKLRVARVLYIYVTLSCALLSLVLPWTDLVWPEAVALGRVLLFLVGGVAGWVGISGDYRRLQYVAMGVAAVAAIEFLMRLPVLVSNYDVAVANASWFGFLSANSVFLALIAGGYLCLRYGDGLDGDAGRAV